MDNILRVNKKNVIIYICCFFILLYPFNATITDLIYPNKLIMLLTIAISEFVLLLISCKKKLGKKQLYVLETTILIITIELISNYYLLQGRTSRVVLFSMYLFLPFIMSLNQKLMLYFDKVIKVFCYEHIFFTYFIIIFKKFYTTVMIPLIASGEIITKKALIYWDSTGYNAGITAHYSTNAIYLSIASIYFFSQWRNKKDKKSIMIFIISFFGLILTAKRAHLLIVIMSCLFIYFIIDRKDEIKNKIKYTTIILICSIIVFGISSIFVPSILNVVNRFKEGFTNGTLLSGREEFYDAAISLWSNKPIFGNRWGYFSEYYQNNIFNLSDPAYNLEYLDCHNVYLQILCECGLVGFIIIVGLMLFIFYKTIKLVNYHKQSKTFLPQLIFSAGYQIFFMAYCLCGNPLYDAQCYVMYFIVIGIIINYLIINSKIKIQNNKDEREYNEISTKN